LIAVRDRTLVLVPNHISYSDANLLEILLHQAGLSDVSDRMTVVAGPKVYSDPVRRFMSLCFGTIKTAQSSSRSSGEAVMPPREVARIAQLTIATAMQRLDAGDALVVFAEGTRSRNAAMQPVLAGVSRYLEREGSLIVPIGITGTDHLNPVGAGELHATRVVIRVGEPMEAAEFVRRATGKRPAMAEALGRAIAATLPLAHRGVYA
jgi:1-acyl-sn-glycerol-3-phosphate acyltransferase